MTDNHFYWSAVAAFICALCFAFRGLLVVRSSLFLRWFAGFVCMCAAVILFPRLQSLAAIRYCALSIVVFAGAVFAYDLVRWLGKHARQFVAVRNPFSKNLPEYMKEICGAMLSLAESKIGALVVVEQRKNIDAFIGAGINFDAQSKAEVLCALFVPSAPTHDGAVVVKKGRIVKIRAILPLTENDEVAVALGTRHRSAIGIAENTDAIVFVVSEERGEVRIGYRGRLVKVESEKHLVKLLRLAMRGKDLPGAVQQHAKKPDKKDKP